ncbi:unnamed protein product, partial [Staurois parvus]
GLAPLGGGEQVPAPTSGPIASSEVEGVLPPCSLLGHVTGPRRLQDHS